MNATFRGTCCIIAIIIAADCSRETLVEPPPSAPPDADLIPLPTGVFLSNSVAQNGSSNSKVFITSAGRAAYISAAPGTYPSGNSASLTNRTRKSGAVTTEIVNGGFDPVRVEADEGDEIGVSIGDALGEKIHYVVKVPARKPPSVVRTNPSKGRIDVALNVQIAVIFSEPIDAGSVSPATVKLTGPHDVSGTITVSDDRLVVVFTPAEPLTAATSYMLSVSGIRDVDGEFLENTYVVDFETERESGEPSFAGELVFVSERSGNAEIYRSNSDGTGVTRLTFNADYDFSPAWSLDGNRIAFVRAPYGALDKAVVYVMNADGSGVEPITGVGFVSSPSWSPDGHRIAFSESRLYPYPASRIGIVTLSEGESSTKYIFSRDGLSAGPSWSPDGSRIAFTVYDYAGTEKISVMSIQPDGSGLAELISPGTVYFFGKPKWSRDGRRIAVSFNCDYPGVCEGSGIGMLTVGQHWSIVNQTAESEFSAAAWAPDGKSVTMSAWNCQDKCARGTVYQTVDGKKYGILLNDGFDADWRPTP